MDTANSINVENVREAGPEEAIVVYVYRRRIRVGCLIVRVDLMFM